MSAWLNISFKGDEDLVAKLTKKGSRIIDVLAVRVTALMQQLATYVVTEKLSGQVLKKQTGALQESVRPIPTVIEGTTIRAGVQAGGGAQFYGNIHTLGHAGEYVITARNSKRRMLQWQTSVKKNTFAYARFVTHPAIPASPFLKPAYEENREDILAELRAALNQAVKES